MPQTVNIETYSDADFVRRYVYRTVGGVPIDLSTDVLRMMVRSYPESVTVHLDLLSTDGGGIIITDAALGAFMVSIPIDVLATLVPGVYVHSLIKTSAAFQGRTEVWRGTLTHRAGPTRWKSGVITP
jgi:hypothetical protein